METTQSTDINTWNTTKSALISFLNSENNTEVRNMIHSFLKALCSIHLLIFILFLLAVCLRFKDIVKRIDLCSNSWSIFVFLLGLFTAVSNYIFMSSRIWNSDANFNFFFEVARKNMIFVFSLTCIVSFTVFWFPQALGSFTNFLQGAETLKSKILCLAVMLTSKILYDVHNYNAVTIFLVVVAFIFVSALVIGEFNIITQILITVTAQIVIHLAHSNTLHHNLFPGEYWSVVFIIYAVSLIYQCFVLAYFSFYTITKKFCREILL